MKFKSLMENHFSKFFSVLYMMIVSVTAFSQTGPPGPTDTEPPADVPFDSNMTGIFLAAGILFAAVVLYKKYRKSPQA